MAAWLALPMADIADDMRPIKVWAQMVGIERMGKMLDGALAQVRGEDANTSTRFTREAPRHLNGRTRWNQCRRFCRQGG